MMNKKNLPQKETTTIVRRMWQLQWSDKRQQISEHSSCVLISYISFSSFLFWLNAGEFFHCHSWQLAAWFSSQRFYLFAIFNTPSVYFTVWENVTIHFYLKSSIFFWNTSNTKHRCAIAESSEWTPNPHCLAHLCFISISLSNCRLNA